MKVEHAGQAVNGFLALVSSLFGGGLKIETSQSVLPLAINPASYKDKLQEAI